jgi:hypothetical protein
MALCWLAVRSAAVALRAAVVLRGVAVRADFDGVFLVAMAARAPC